MADRTQRRRAKHEGHVARAIPLGFDVGAQRHPAHGRELSQNRLSSVKACSIGGRRQLAHCAFLRYARLSGCLALRQSRQEQVAVDPGHVALVGLLVEFGLRPQAGDIPVELLGLRLQSDQLHQVGVAHRTRPPALTVVAEALGLGVGWQHPTTPSCVVAPEGPSVDVDAHTTGKGGSEHLLNAHVRQSVRRTLCPASVITGPDGPDAAEHGPQPLQPFLRFRDVVMKGEGDQRQENNLAAGV